MPLINLLNKPGEFGYYNSDVSTTTTFGQKDIKYSNDKPFEGKSNQPFIQKPIPEVISLDTPSRTNPIKAIKDDIIRLKKFLASPDGIAFIFKQNLLAKQQPKRPSGMYPQNLYDPESIILNAGGIATGTHFGGKGLPYNIFDTTNRYLFQTQTKYNDNDGETTNPLTKLYKKLFDKNNKKVTSIDYIMNLFSTERSTDTTKWETQLDLIKFPENKFNVFTTKILIDYSKNNRKGPNTIDTITDFRNALDNTVVAQSDYTDFNRQKTYVLGDPGRGLKRTFGFKGTEDTKDKINWSNIHTTEKVKETLKDQDIIPFYISVLNPDNSKEETYIHFRAFIEGGITDSYNAEWSGVKYMGRGENFYNYNGFSRKLSLKFIVHAQSQLEQDNMYIKLNYLASLMAPNYSNNGNGFMRGNIIKLTIGDYLTEVPGILNGLSFNIAENYTWDIGRDQDGKKDGLALPHLISVDGFDFTPIHSFLPKTDENARFISMGGTGKVIKNRQDEKTRLLQEAKAAAAKIAAEDVELLAFKEKKKKEEFFKGLKSFR